MNTAVDLLESIKLFKKKVSSIFTPRVEIESHLRASTKLREVRSFVLLSPISFNGITATRRR